MKKKQMKFKYKNVYITGANGWLGQKLVSTLLYGDEDVIEEFENNECKISSLFFGTQEIKQKENKRNKIFIGDIRIKKDCNKFLNNSEGGILFHTAAVIHPRKIKDFYDINYLGTKNIVEEGIIQGIKKFIIMSSNSPIGCNKSSEDPFDETSSYNPYMGYGKSKMLMEEYLNKKINQGIDITIIRSPWFYGENMPSRQIFFYKMIKKGIVPVIGSGNNLRSKANIKNIVQGFIKASFYEISKGKTYWIADSEPYTYNYIINSTREIMKNEFNLNVKNTIIRLPFFVGQVAEIIDSFLQFVGIYSQKIHVLSELNKNIFCSVELAKKEINYDPKINFKKGMITVISQNLNSLNNEK